MSYREPKRPIRKPQLTNLSTRIAGLAIERWQLELESRRPAETYRAHVENMNDDVFSLDVEGRFSYVGPTIEKFS